MTLRHLALLLPSAIQALRARRGIPKLPEAAGPRTGENGTGPTLRLLILGDSAAAGVGVVTQEEALSGQTIKRLQSSWHVSWRVWAKSGATTASLCASLPSLAPHTSDVVVLVIGLNDAKNGVSLRRFRNNMCAILDHCDRDLKARQIIVSALPPIGAFPALPWPLREVLGVRRDKFDTALQALLGAYPTVDYLPLDFDLDPSHLARDGFHPGPKVYAVWAARVAAAVARRGDVLVSERSDPKSKPGHVSASGP